MRTDFSDYLKTHEQYKTLCVSTGDLTEGDLEALHEMSGVGEIRSSEMVMERDTGFFVKLYEELDYNQTQFRSMSTAFVCLMEAALEAGFRMIEIDCDADTTEDWIDK